MKKKLIILLIVLVIVACSFSGCVGAIKSLPKAAMARLAVGGAAAYISDAEETYSDSDTLPWNWMQAYELYGEKGTKFKIHYEGNAPVDLLILDAKNYNIYDRALDSGRYTTKINGKYWSDRKEVNIAFTQPDNQQYYFVIDNTDLFGAKSGRSVTYSLTLN